MQGNSEEVCNIQVAPREQRRVTLGEFETSEAFKGFIVEFGSNLRSNKTVTTQIQQVESASKPGASTFFMHIANQGKKTLRATVHTV
jgi:hypothetical protein